MKREARRDTAATTMVSRPNSKIREKIRMKKLRLDDGRHSRKATTTGGTKASPANKPEKLINVLYVCMYVCMYVCVHEYSGEKGRISIIDEAIN